MFIKRLLIVALCTLLVILTTIPSNIVNADVDLTLHVDGNKIKNSAGQIVRLYGVNCPSLEWNPKGEHMPDVIISAYDDWGSNLLRVPMNQDFWFGYGTSQSDDGAAYRKIINTIVNIAKDRNKYILLELHWSNGGTEWGQYTGQHKMPDENSVKFWESVTQEFKNHPNVWFGLYNEPYDVSWAVWKDGGNVNETVKILDGSKQVSKNISYNAVGMQQLIDTIRSHGTNNILVIGGLDWGFDLTYATKEEYELKDTPDGNGLVFDTHPYPWKNKNWTAIIDKTGEKYPVLVGEFGIEAGKSDTNKPDESQFKNYFETIYDWMDTHQYSYTAWTLHPSAGPSIIKNWDFEPTPYHGEYVKAHLIKMSIQGVSFYSEKDYSGDKVSLLTGEYTKSDLIEAGIQPASIQSIKLNNDPNQQYNLTLFTEDNFIGESMTFISNILDLEQIIDGKQIASLKLESIALENINLGSSAEASIGNKDASAVADGNESTKWLVDEEGDKWIKTDLGSLYTLHRIIIKHASSKELQVFHNNQDFKVSVSADGENWIEVYSTTENKEYKTTIDFEPEIGQYIKVDITKGSQMVPGTRTTISEIEAYGMKDIRAEKYEKGELGFSVPEKTMAEEKIINTLTWLYIGIGVVILTMVYFIYVKFSKR